MRRSTVIAAATLLALLLGGTTAFYLARGDLAPIALQPDYLSFGILDFLKKPSVRSPSQKPVKVILACFDLYWPDLSAAHN